MAFSVYEYNKAKAQKTPPPTPAGGYLDIPTASTPPQGFFKKAWNYLNSPVPSQIPGQGPKKVFIPETLKYLPGAALEKVKGVGNWVGKQASSIPLGQVGKGLIDVESAREARNIIGKGAKMSSNLRSQTLAKLIDSRVKGDRNLEQRMLKILQWQSEAGSSVVDEILAQAPSTRQIVASGAYAALTAVGGYKPYLQTGKLAHGSTLKAATGFATATKIAAQAEKLKGAGLATKALYRYGFPIAKQAAIGAGVFGSLEATNKEATPQSIIGAAKKGAIISGGITAGAIALGDTINAFNKYGKPLIAKKFSEGVAGLQKASEGTDVDEKATSQVAKTLSYLGKEHRTVKQKAADLALSVIRGGSKAKMLALDRFAPLKKSWNAYRDARMYTSVADAKAELMVKNLAKQLEPLDDISDEYTAYITQLDFIDRAKAGLQVPGDQSLDDLQAGLKQILKEVDSADIERLEQAKNTVNAYTRSLLQMRLEAGLISQKQMDAMIKAHPNYIPHNVIMDLDDKIAQGLSSSLNVAKTDLQAAVGSVKNIDDPLTALTQRTPIATRIVEKNKVLQSLVDSQDEFNLFPGMKEIAPGAKPGHGLGTINFFRDGVKQTWQVPEDIAIAVKNLDSTPTPTWWRIMTTPQRWLKKGATQYNPSFFLPNKFRDEQTSLLRSRALIESMAKQTGVSPQMIDMTDDQIRELYKLSGGYGSSVFLDGDDAKIWTDLTKSGVLKKLDSANPLHIIESLNSSIETSTRLEVFRKALERGLSPQNAAFASREATVDFAKMGAWMRLLNQAIPFLNARVQGFVNIPDTIAKNPEVFARMQMYTSVYPTLALHQWNRQFPSYANISTYMKSKYWTIVTGESEGRDFNGNKIVVPNFIAIPKGEGQSLVANPIQYYLDRADGVDPRKVSEMLMDTLGNASPVSFQTFSRDSNIWGSLISQVGPAGTNLVGLATNVDPYTGQKIIPESRMDARPEVQYTKFTPEIIKQAAKIMGVAPAKLDFFINSFGGAPQDLVKAADLIQGVWKGENRTNPLTPTKWGQAARLPVMRRFLKQSGESGSPLLDSQRDIKEKVDIDVNTEKILQNDVAEDIYRTLKTMDQREDRVAYLNSIKPMLNKTIIKRIIWLKTNGQSIEALKKYDSTETRARYILVRLEEMKKEGTREARIEFLNQLKYAKILSKAVYQRMLQIRKDPALFQEIRNMGGGAY